MDKRIFGSSAGMGMNRPLAYSNHSDTRWFQELLGQGAPRLRGPEFEPRLFRDRKLSCPDIADKQGRQFLLPVMRVNRSRRGNPRKEQRRCKPRLARRHDSGPHRNTSRLGMATNQSKGRVNGHLRRLEKERLVVKRLNKWCITNKGKEAVS